MRTIMKMAPAALLLAAAGCSDPLSVTNLSSPDVDRVFATPSAIEQTIGTGYQSAHNAMATTNLMPQLQTIALESYSSLNNFDMGVRTAIPRPPVQNSVGSPSIFADFSSLSRGGRLAANAVNALDRLNAAGNSLGTPAQDLRARAFGFFVVGVQQGWLAMVYDSAGAVVPGMPSDSIPPLSSAKVVMEAAITMFDTAIALASLPAATGTGGFPIPDSWVGGATAHTSRDNFVRLVRSYRARFRAGVARTPEERNAVNWNLVAADADNGIQTDWMVNSGGTTGWNIGFVGSQMHVDGGWHQMSLMYFGMADVSGAYNTWLATPLTDRAPFLVITPDKRWPQGNTRAEQRTASVQPTGITSRPYISNRSSQDVGGDGWGWSFYDFFRLKYIRNSSNIGPWPEMVKAEIDLLAAEAHIRLGNFAAAAAKIDISRVGRGELPALTGVITSASQAVPGGASCVPRVPAPPAFTSTVCGNIMEAMKWEKRMETAFTSYARWWTDSRGWGDLIAGTHYEYPVPYQELNARQKPTYNLGGGGKSSAAKGTYGF